VLDTPTLLAVISMINIFEAVLVLFVWRGDVRYAGMREIKIGLPLFAASAVLSALRNVLPATPTIGVANLGIFAGSILSMNGTLMLAAKSTVWRLQSTLIGLIFLPFFYYLIFEPSIPVRNGLGALSSCCLALTTMIALLRGSAGAGSRTTRLTLAAVLLFHGLTEAARGVTAPFIDPSIDFRSPSPILSITSLELIFFTLAVTVLMLQLVNERLRDDLQRSEARITAAFHVATDAFALFDREGRLITVNQRFEELFPDTVEKARPGNSLAELFALRTERFGLEPCWIAACSTGTQKNISLDRITRLPNGTWLHVSAEGTQDGGLVLCWSDITVFKQAEDALTAELVQQRELTTAQRSFVSMASHQFRTPLSIIDINAQLLEPRGSLALTAAEVSQRTARIRRTVKRMIRLIETMLGAASAEAGSIQLNRTPVDLKALLMEACERKREIAIDRTIELEMTQMTCLVECDPTLIEQVVGNLLSNAMKYSRKPSKVIVRGYMEGNFAVIEVVDFGLGIAKEDQVHIFERFFRAHNVGDIAGTGIGLTLARYIIDLHGGEISVDSQLGSGSTFTVRLPLS